MAQNNGLYASWDITRACNFNCKYCRSHAKDTRLQHLDPGRLCNTLREHGKDWTVHISGGEPFLYPGFIEICQELTREFCIKVNSNLSVNPLVRKFSENIDPKSVLLVETSLHIEERERLGNLEDFIGNVQLLKSRGFKVGVKAVLRPDLIKRFAQDRRYFESRGIPLLPKPFKGSYMGKLYPKAYPKQIRDFLSKSTPSNAFYPFCFKGIKCASGKSFVRINLDGLVTRCLDDSCVLGNIHDGFKLSDTAAPCRSYRCSCFGYDLIENRPFGRQDTNYNLLHQYLASVKYMSIKGFFLRVSSFVQKPPRTKGSDNHGNR